MDHKAIKHKLERLKIEKLQEVRELQVEISNIDESIRYHDRQYKLNNKNSDECGRILDGYNRENVRDILVFLINSLAEHDAEYMRKYKGIDLVELSKDQSFFDFLIIEIGRPTIVELKKRFSKITKIDGEDTLEVNNGHRHKNRENFKNRLYKKLTKKSVIEEAKRRENERNSSTRGR